MMRATLLLSIVAVMAVGCGTPADAPPAETSTSAAAPAAVVPPPSPSEVAQIVADSAEWSEYQFTHSAWSFQLGTPIAHPTTRQLADDLAAAGWMRVTRDGLIELTEKAKSDKRFLVRQNNSLDIVPMAKKEIVEIPGVTSNPDGTVRADVNWKWIPNEVGASFRSGFIRERYDAPQRATATLAESGGRWVVARIEPAT